MSDPNHTSRTSKIDIRIPHDLLARLDAIAARTNGNRTSAILLVLSAGMPAAEAAFHITPPALTKPPVRARGVPPEWVERWRDRFGVVPDAEIARAEGMHATTVWKWRTRVERG